MTRFFVLTLLSACAVTITTQTILASAILAGSVTLQLVARQFKFTEGLAADKSGNVFFTGRPHGKIWKYSTDGQLNIFLEKSGRANGTYFDK